MKEKGTDTVIGYSGLDLFEECYEYFENACYIADTPEAMERLIIVSFTCTGEFRIEPATVGHIMNDYGCSNGEFAMEPGAFDRFKAAAMAKGIRFQAKREDCDVPIMVVNVEDVKIQDDW